MHVRFDDYDSQSFPASVEFQLDVRRRGQWLKDGDSGEIILRFRLVVLTDQRNEEIVAMDLFKSCPKLDKAIKTEWARPVNSCTAAYQDEESAVPVEMTGR